MDAARLPVVGTGTVGATALSAPAVIAARALGTGVPVTVAVPAGAGFLQLQVLTTTGKPLFSTVKKVKGGTKVRVRIRSAKLRRQVRSGKRYVIAVRTGPTTRRLGTAVKRTVRIR